MRPQTETLEVSEVGEAEGGAEVFAKLDPVVLGNVLEYEGDTVAASFVSIR